MIVLFEAIEHVLDVDRIMAVVKERLRPYGTLLVSTPDAEGRYGMANSDPEHLRVYSHRGENELPANLRDGRPVISLPDYLREQGFQVVSVELQDELLQERRSCARPRPAPPRVAIAREQRGNRRRGGPRQRRRHCRRGSVGPASPGRRRRGRDPATQRAGNGEPGAEQASRGRSVPSTTSAVTGTRKRRRTLHGFAGKRRSSSPITSLVDGQPEREPHHVEGLTVDECVRGVGGVPTVGRQILGVVDRIRGERGREDDRTVGTDCGATLQGGESLRHVEKAVEVRADGAHEAAERVRLDQRLGVAEEKEPVGRVRHPPRG